MPPLTRPSSSPDVPVEELGERLVRAEWTVLPYRVASGSEQMAADLELLEWASAGQGPTLRFYGWDPPCVSIGRFQRVDSLNLEELRARGLDWVRRPTGGRAILHDRELTYAIAVPPRILLDTGVLASYQALSGLIERAVGSALDLPFRSRTEHSAITEPASPISSRGVVNCFALLAEGDSALAEGKLIGSAQVRRDGAVLQHGSLLLSVDREAWRALFGTTGRMISLADVLDHQPSPEGLAAQLAGAWSRTLRNALGSP